MKIPSFRILAVNFLTLIPTSYFFLSCGAPENDFLIPSNPPAILPAQPSPAPHPYPDVHGGEVHGEKNFATLINEYSSGKSEPIPWAGYWWPYSQNGIATASFGGLSPAGKYDAARGNTTHSQQWELRKHGMYVPNMQSWWGHCNGWCAASALYPEPAAPVVVNGITFSIGDIKGLLSEAAMSANADFFGERVDKDDPNSPKYWDTVPDQYFLVLTNYIGKLKKTVLIDRYTGSQIWNQPLAGYRFEYPSTTDYLGNSPDSPNVYRVMVTSTLWWMNDGVPPDVQTLPFNFQTDDSTGVVQSRTLRMEVWLDGPVVFDTNGKIKSSGDVIVTRNGEYVTGGAWRMGDSFLVDAWPDYMWIPYAVVKATDPDQDYVNPEVDIEWLQDHLLVAGGADDTSVPGATVSPAPSGYPSGIPSWMPGSNPWGIPSTPGLPNGIPNTGIPGAGIPGAGIPGAGIPGSGIPGSGIPGSGIPGSNSGGFPGLPH